MRRRADGTVRCTDCMADPEPDRSRCAACREKHRAASAVRRAALKARGRCVVCAAHAEHGTLCVQHRAYYAERTAAQYVPGGDVGRHVTIEWDAQPLGQMPDAELARQLGVSRYTVAYARRARGIPSHGRRTT